MTNPPSDVRSFSSSEANRAAGVLLGLAAGDRNGDATHMAGILAQSLLDKPPYDMIHTAEQYFAWWQEGNHTKGSTFDKVMTLIADGTNLDRAVAQAHRESKGQTADTSAAHRAAPLAMAGNLPDQRLTHLAELEAAITHWDPLAGEVTSTVVSLCRTLIRGTEWTQACKETGYGRSFRVNMALQPIAIKECKTTRHAPDALQAAITILDQHQSLPDALEHAFAFAGESDECPILVGSIGGARWGAANIPHTLLQHLTPDTTQHIEHCTYQLAHTFV